MGRGAHSNIIVYYFLQGTLVTSRKKETPEERRFVKILKRDYNIKAIKFRDPSRLGAPDRMVVLPHAPVFIEFKRDEDEDPRESQIAYHEWLRGLGYKVYVCWNAEQALAKCGL
jgi:hypothetical protein